VHYSGINGVQIKTSKVNQQQILMAEKEGHKIGSKYDQID
jgi:hypothetical protein